MKVAFNIKLRNIFRLICIDENDLGNAEIFFNEVVQKFRITAPNGIDLELYNSKRAPIDFELLPILVKQHKNDPNFFIEVRADKPGVYIQQSENLENYLRDSNCESILAEEKRNKCINEESLTFLLDRLRDFVQNEYSLNPTPDNLTEACEAVIELFPSLASDSNQKIDILYDRANRSGLLYEKIRYKQRKRYDKKTAAMDFVISKPMNQNDKKTIDELIGFFESCVISQDKSAILEKMKSSVEVRKLSNQSDRIIFDKCFHLYRVEPELVLVDFKLMFENVDSDALFTNWESIKKKPFELFQITLDRKIDTYHRDETVHNILTFVKLFPTHKSKFEKSVQSLIVFSDESKVDPQNLINKKSDYPHIICIYSKAEKRSKYYLAVSKALMNIPSEYTFLQIMDLFFKIHFIFFVPFEPSLVQFMSVFEKYVYGINGDAKIAPANKNKAKTVFQFSVQDDIVEED